MLRRLSKRTLQFVLLAIAINYAAPYLSAAWRAASSGAQPVERQFGRSVVEFGLWLEEIPGQAGNGSAVISWLMATRDPIEREVIERFLEIK